MTEQREPSSRLWMSSRWHLLLLVALLSLPVLWWLGFQWTELESNARMVLVICSLVFAIWWLPLAVHYFTLFRCARVWIQGDELIVSRWGNVSYWAIDDDLRLRGVGEIWGASMVNGYSRGVGLYNLFVGILEAIAGPLHRESFGLFRESGGRSGDRVLFLPKARFKSEGEPFQPGMRALRAELAELRTARKAALAEADASKLPELEQAQEEERAAIAVLAERARVSSNPIKRMRKLRKDRRD